MGQSIDDPQAGKVQRRGISFPASTVGCIEGGIQLLHLPTVLQWVNALFEANVSLLCYCFILPVWVFLLAASAFWNHTQSSCLHSIRKVLYGISARRVGQVGFHDGGQSNDVESLWLIK
ncbi:hypothetical protein IW261DRAFT_1428366 [Armillaria novae-zelandiae]|uniref:Uncharacterized protein n=1 Tax=Armillaria novae-zelandiae TaxID=153914 RepID=A0AA39N9K3_9AGAR|nr:hypothetical protein IW261DRAFT_1428366 [Armillaria novae-zelandiae]